MNRTNLFLMLGGVLLWVLALIGYYHVIEQHLADPISNPFYLISYTAALVALAGWMVQSWVSMRNSRKQHTINVLFQTRMSPTYITHVENVALHYPDTVPITFQGITAVADKSVYESVRFVLNYYEFIAVGIRHGDLDEKLMRDCICSQMCTFCDRCEDFIRTVRGESTFGAPDPKKARLLRHLRWLHRRWGYLAKNEPKPAIHVRLARCFCGHRSN